MTFKEFKDTCIEAGLYYHEYKTKTSPTFSYNGYIICRFIKMNGEFFINIPTDNTYGLAYFPVGDFEQRQCVLSGAPLKNKIYKVIKFIKEYEIQQKKKEIEKDFEV